MYVVREAKSSTIVQIESEFVTEAYESKSIRTVTSENMKGSSAEHIWIDVDRNALRSFSGH